VEEKVENYIKDIVGSVALDAEITVTQKNYFDFSDIGNPEKLMTDVNGNGEFDTDAGADGRGGANDVVFYTADISMPRLLPWHGFVEGMSPTIDMELETAVRSQPYGNQATPPVICAEPD
jgi:hypothetical protein